MYFDGPIVKKLGDVDTELIADIVLKIENRFGDKFTSRSKLDTGTQVLKIIAPLPNVDMLPPEDTLYIQTITKPLLDLVELESNEFICYADISNLLPQTKVPLHIDFIWMHLLSRRIHIPLKTNDKVKMGFLTARDQVHVEQLPVGAIYELNNELPHAVFNAGETDRWHLLIDVIDREIYNIFEKRKGEPAFSPSMNWVWGDISYYHMYKELIPGYELSKK